MAQAATMQVKIGADITDLETGLSRAQRLALYASGDFKKAFEATQSTTAGQKALNAEIDQSTAKLRQMMSVANLKNKEVVAALKEEVAAQKEWAQAVGATTDQMFKLALVEQRIDNASAKIQDQTRAVSGLTGEVTSFGKKGISVFSGVLMAATQFGNDGSTALQKVLTGASGLALAFGPEGAVVSALASGALAFVNYFSKARDEMAKTRAKFAEELAAMQNTGGTKGQIDIQGKLRTIEQGTPAAGGADGLIGMRVRQRQLATQVAAEPIITDRFGEVRKAATPAAKELAELTARIIELDTQAQNLKYALLNPPTVPGDITGIRPFEIHGKDPFSTKKAKKEKELSPLRTYSELMNTPVSLTLDRSKVENAGLGLYGGNGGKMPKVAREIPQLFDPKMQASMDKVASETARQIASQERLSSTMIAVGTQFVTAVGNLVASKLFGNSTGGQIGGGLGGMIGGAVAAANAGGIGRFLVNQGLSKTGSKVIGGLIGSAIPVVGTIAGGLIGAGVGKLLGHFFGHHEKAVDKNTKAVQDLTTSIRNQPSGFYIEPYLNRFAARRANPNSPTGQPDNGSGISIGTPRLPIGNAVVNHNYQINLPNVTRPEEVGPAFMEYLRSVQATTTGVNVPLAEALDFAA